jgi:hypothetical protein
MAYVMMAIPAELVPAVTTFLEGQSSAPSRGEEIGAAAEEDGFVNGWTSATVRRAYRESADQMRHLLGFLASNPGKEISSYELADAIGAKYGWNTVAGMLGAFGRRCANRYGRPQPMWELRYDRDGRILLTLPPGPAKAIKAIAGEE